MSYLDTVNHPNFREASLLVWQVRNLLKNMGMTHEQAFGLIKAWGSGAGDGDVGLYDEVDESISEL